MLRRLVITLGLLAALAGCGPQKYALVSSGRAPGADAVLTADIQQEQGRTALEFTVTNLAPPDRIQPGDTAFVAWFRKDERVPWQRIGALKYDPETRAGELVKASVPVTAFDLEVTSERLVEPASPSPVVVFGQRVQKEK